MGGLGTEQGKFYKPKGIVMDDNLKIYVLDFGNHRGQIFNTNGEFINMFGMGEQYTQNYSQPNAEPSTLPSPSPNANN